jgi:lauroyl/myristoyl acyltransferase
MNDAGVSKAERLAVSSLLHGYARVPGFMHRIRPLMVRQTWRRAPFWREALRENGRIILGREADEGRLEAYGLGVLEYMQRYMEGLVVASQLNPETLLKRIDTVEGLTDFREYFQDRKRRGLILLSIHMGEFEPAAAFMSRHAPVHVLYRRDRIKTLETIRARARGLLGVTGHAVDDGLAAWMRLRDVLDRGEVVALLGDRVQPGQTGTFMPMFGRHMEIPVGPFKLAQATGSRLIPVFNWWLPDGRLAMRMEAPIEVEGDLRRDPGSNPAMRRWVELVEARIRATPEQWLNVHPVWRGGESAIAGDGDDRSAA